VRDHASPNLRDDDDERDPGNSSQQAAQADSFRHMEGPP
jgi:hypothetical protein